MLYLILPDKPIIEKLRFQNKHKIRKIIHLLVKVRRRRKFLNDVIKMSYEERWSGVGNKTP